MSTSFRLVIALAGLAFTGCGKPGFSCDSQSCDCPVGDTCSESSACGGKANCSVSCEAHTSCTATCGPNCVVVCNGDRCTVTVGAGSQVGCGNGACTVACEGACAVTGTTDVSCAHGAFDRNQNACL